MQRGTVRRGTSAPKRVVSSRRAVVTKAVIEGRPAEVLLPKVELWTPNATNDGIHKKLIQTSMREGGPGAAATGGGSDQHKPRTPPPDLPSLLLDSRIIYLGMPLVPAVTELIISELLYCQYRDRSKPIYLYINSTGCTRADGETVGFETEGTAIYDTMTYVKNPIYSVAVGVAYGQAAMLLSAGTQGHRYMLPHATCMLHQPRVPPTGQRQAIEVEIKWREVLAQKQSFLEIMSKTTGHDIEKIDRDIQRPNYMDPEEAKAYGLIDNIVRSQQEANLVGGVIAASAYDKAAGLRPVQQ